MHNAKPRPQLLHHDAQGCTFCTELIGGLVVMPCTTILRIWTPFLPCSLDHIVNSHRWVYSFWRVGTAATGRPETSSSLLTTKANTSKISAQPHSSRNRLELVAVVGSEQRNDLMACLRQKFFKLLILFEWFAFCTLVYKVKFSITVILMTSLKSC